MNDRAQAHGNVIRLCGRALRLVIENRLIHGDVIRLCGRALQCDRAQTDGNVVNVERNYTG